MAFPAVSSEVIEDQLGPPFIVQEVVIDENNGGSKLTSSVDILADSVATELASQASAVVAEVEKIPILLGDQQDRVRIAKQLGKLENPILLADC